jgi:hypothetical protein
MEFLILGIGIPLLSMIYIWVRFIDFQIAQLHLKLSAFEDKIRLLLQPQPPQPPQPPQSPQSSVLRLFHPDSLVEDDNNLHLE